MLGTNANCNFCGDTCALANAASQCGSMGNGFVCNLVQCNSGYANCDMIASNGCEVDTMTDANNCGMCTNACAPGQACAGGVCVLADAGADAPTE
jgi:hypothetical protein